MTAVYDAAAQISACYLAALDPTLLFSCTQKQVFVASVVQNIYLRASSLKSLHYRGGWVGGVLSSFHSKGFFYNIAVALEFEEGSAK